VAGAEASGGQVGASVFQWAQVPGPVGGVRRCVEDLSAVLEGDGATVRRVNTASAPDALRMLPRVWERRSLHLFHITRLWRAIVLGPLFALLPGRTVLVLHSGSTRRQVAGMGRWHGQVLRLALHAYDELWAVTDEIGALLPAGLRERVRVVSPFVALPPDEAVEPRDAELVTVATNAGQDHYGADLALDALALARGSRPDLRLWVLAYGDDSAQLATLRRRVEELPWVRWSFNLSPHQVADALARSAIFLRPTSWDGDALIVREALAAGTRVVASDTAPRPVGVELSTLNAGAFAQALLHGGRPSDGRGLASRSIVDAARDALATLRR
jgi:glycosyltransferase involved in cell wall biosynthesis